MERVEKANTFADMILKYGKITAVLGAIVGGAFLYITRSSIIAISSACMRRNLMRWEE